MNNKKNNPKIIKRFGKGILEQIKKRRVITYAPLKDNEWEALKSFLDL